MTTDALHILYVEDNPADVQLMRDLLREVPDHGLIFLHCESLREVRELTLRRPPDAILLDLNLPDTRGLESYRAIADLYPHQPVIILTVIDLQDRAIEAVRAGAQDYLIKGQLTGLFICRCIRYATERMAMTRRLYRDNQHLEERIAERTEALARANRQLMAEIEERKHQELALQEQRQVLQSILDGLQAGVLFIEGESLRIVDVNPLAERLLGQDRRALLGQNCSQLLCPEQGSPPLQACPWLHEISLHRDQTLYRPDGVSVPVLQTVLPTTLDGREHFIIILLDATERKAMERQLALAQKLEAVGRLAAGIAHEINTPVQYIGGNIDFFDTVQRHVQEIIRVYATLEEALRSGHDYGQLLADLAELRKNADLDHLLEEFRQALIDSHEGVQHITDIVQAMKKFSHPGTEQRSMIDVNNAIRNTVTISRNEWKYTSDMRLQLDDDLPHIRCVSGELNQVLLNIIVNAAQANAMKQQASGSQREAITIRTHRNKDRVLISITDTGTGIPDAIKDKIFDPFFTSKGVGEGTGQGLAIVYSIIHRHGGSIEVTSREGIGTTFTVTMPIEPPQNGEIQTRSAS